MEWKKEEVDYLTALANNCRVLANRYKLVYDKYRNLETRFKIPSIIISSTMGLLSFGSNNFGDEKVISILVGCVSVGLSILTSIESYMKIGQIMSSAILTSNNLTKLNEHIHLELALPESERSASGIMFLRGCYTQYEKIIESAPNDILKKIRFIGIEDLKDSLSPSDSSIEENPCKVVVVKS